MLAGTLDVSSSHGLVCVWPRGQGKKWDFATCSHGFLMVVVMVVMTRIQNEERSDTLSFDSGQQELMYYTAFITYFESENMNKNASTLFIIFCTCS